MDYDPDWPEPCARPRPTNRARIAFGAALCYAFVVVASCLWQGCATDPATGEVSIRVPAAAVDFATNAIREYLESRAATAEGAADVETDAGESLGSTESAPSSVPAAASAALDFRYGGFKGGKAAEDPRCRLSSPTITADTIRYKWETKAPADWARSKTESGNLVVAAAFFWDDGAKKWVGGKFEWTDESRSSRSCANIHEGYGGWNAAAWKAAKKRAFCVVSADGKYRSNLLEDQP